MKEETKATLKKLGLEYAEVVSEQTVEYVFKLIQLVIEDSTNVIDDMLLAALPPLKKIVLQYVQKIDKSDEEA